MQVVLSIAEKMETSVAFLSGKTDDISPDAICIYKNDNPLLFEFIKSAQSTDDTTLQRLLSYYHTLTNNTIKSRQD